jgi:hypothetical protein
MRPFKFLLGLAVAVQAILAFSLFYFRLPKDPSLGPVLPFIILVFALLDTGALLHGHFKQKVAKLTALLEDTTKRLNGLEEYYESVKEDNKEIRKLGHDIDNIILSVVILMDQGESETAKAVLEKITETRKASRTLTLCGNHVANSVLLTKAVEARRLGINFYPDVRLDEVCPVPSITIMRIFTNVLDNAIAGAAQAVETEGKERSIRITSSIRSGIFLVNCVNSTGPPAKRSKQSAGYHGLGTSILKDLAAENGGSCSFSEFDTYFQVQLSLIANQAEFDKAKELEGKIEYLSSAPRADDDEDDDVFELGVEGEVVAVKDGKADKASDGKFDFEVDSGDGEFSLDDDDDSGDGEFSLDDDADSEDGEFSLDDDDDSGDGEFSLDDDADSEVGEFSLDDEADSEDGEFSLDDEADSSVGDRSNSGT